MERCLMNSEDRMKSPPFSYVLVWTRWLWNENAGNGMLCASSLLGACWSFSLPWAWRGSRCHEHALYDLSWLFIFRMRWWYPQVRKERGLWLGCVRLLMLSVVFDLWAGDVSFYFSVVLLLALASWSLLLFGLRWSMSSSVVRSCLTSFSSCCSRCSFCCSAVVFLLVVLRLS